jgi:histidinol-phosphatase (PHP family)
MMPKISCHGGHSGEFCLHARDTLAEIVAEYHAQGFTCVCLTEHMPPETDAWLYPDERATGMSAADLRRRFEHYIQTARRLAEEYAGRMTVLVGMETEWYPGADLAVARWRDRLDMVVGSVHHVWGIGFDYSAEYYAEAMRVAGGLIAAYEAYFDAQHEMLRTVRPEVVGHFDLIRLHDPDYTQTMSNPSVWARIVRNLEWVRENGAILDVNARALLKIQHEPYVCLPILSKAASMGIVAAPGDDAHGVGDVGKGMDRVGEILVRLGLDARLSDGDPGALWAMFSSRRPTGVDSNRASPCQP